MPGHVLIAYLVDAEGPLYESLDATFERLEEYFRVSLEPDPELLRRLQEGDIPPELREQVSGREESLRNMISPVRLNFASEWRTLDERVSRCFEREIRTFLPDARGRPLVYSWFAVDRVGMDDNPRRRALGYHQIFDFYQDKLQRFPGFDDEIYWHHHEVSFTRAAHRCATALHFTNAHISVLSRRLVDRGSFPVAFRPGCDVERTDLNLFLEQWVPFDFGNMAGPMPPKERQDLSAGAGRFNDWRFAPSDWGVYHPDIYDVQEPGVLNRYIARCRYVEGRIYQVTQDDLAAAFEIAQRDGQALLTVMSHDTRDLPAETLKFLEMVKVASAMFPDVTFEYENARGAMQRYLGLSQDTAPTLSAHFEGKELIVNTSTDIWGSQPFLAFKTLTNQYFHDNLAKIGEGAYSYRFDRLSIPAQALEIVALGCHDRNGNTAVLRLEVDTPGFDPTRVREV